MSDNLLIIKIYMLNKLLIPNMLKRFSSVIFKALYLGQNRYCDLSYR